MKNICLTIIVVLISISFGYTQSCFPSGLTFSSQNDLDLFPELYPDCTVIDGDLVITGNDIVNVDSLYNITKVKGELKVYDTFVTNLAGLSSLDTVYQKIEIGWNDELIDLAGLNSLQGFGCNSSECYGGYFRVYRCDKIVSLNGLENVKNFASLTLQNNKALLSLEGLDNVDSIGTISVEQCDAMQSLSGIETLIQASKFKVFYCDNLTSLVDMPNLTQLDELDIRGNDNLLNLDGLDSVNLIRGIDYGNAEVRINNNGSLNDISALGEVDFSEVYQFEIEDNPNLAICNYSSICDRIDSGSQVSIHSNNTGCNGIVELVGQCCTEDPIYCPPTTTVCFENGVEFGSQSDIDAFPSVYPNCTIIGGNLKISSNDVFNVDSLYNITKVMGQLIVYDTYVTNLAGLSSLDTVYQKIELGWNDELVNLEGLNSLQGFGCNSTECYGGYFRVYYCDKITSLYGLENVKNFSSLVLQNNEALLSLDGLDSVDSIGTLSIEQCDAMQSLSGIETLLQASLFKVFYCDNLTTLTDMPNLMQLDEIDIRGNGNLLSLDGLDSVKVVRGIDYGNAEVRIMDNVSLNDISALSDIDFSEVYQFQISGNSSLAMCTYPSICNRIDSGSQANIFNNMSGCNGIAELVDLCCAEDEMWCPPLTTVCFESGVIFGSQSDIDAFPSTYPDCTTIGGDLKLTGNDIVNVDSLYNITKVMGELIVYDTYLTDLAGLSSLDTVYQKIEFGWNDELINLEGLNSLKEFGCNSTDCNGGYFRIYYCEKITSLSGLERLKNFSSVVLQSNDALLSLDGLDSIKTVGDLRIEQCDGLTSLAGIETLAEASLFKVFYCDNLTSLTSMDSLTQLDEIDIRGNSNLLNLDGLDSVKVVRGIDYGNGQVRVNNNVNLNDISAIGDIDYSDVYSFEISGNPLLTVCAYPGICSYVEDYENAVFGGNGIGCSGQLEVEQDCEGVLSIFEPNGSSSASKGVTSTFYWHDSNNWRNGLIPTEDCYVIIPEQTTCIIEEDSVAVCKDIYIHPDAEIDCLLNSELKILGND